MSENLELKKVVVDEIKAHAQNSKAIVLVDYKGITVAQDTALRNTFRESGVVYKVYKNKLLKRAFEELGITFEDGVLEGPTAVAFSTEDVVAPAKIAVDNAKVVKTMKVKSAYVEGKILNEKVIKELAAIPSKEVLVAQLLGMLTSPMRSLAVALSEIAKKNA